MITTTIRSSMRVKPLRVRCMMSSPVGVKRRWSPVVVPDATRRHKATALPRCQKHANPLHFKRLHHFNAGLPIALRMAFRTLRCSVQQSTGVTEWHAIPVA